MQIYIFFMKNSYFCVFVLGIALIEENLSSDKTIAPLVNVVSENNRSWIDLAVRNGHLLVLAPVGNYSLTSSNV